MRFSVQWLKQWVEVELDAAELAERLTNAGLEVAAVTPVAAPFTGVVVGEITECSPHPDADKLTVCRIDAGDGEPLQVVCGAPNARAGLKVPLARVGAVLADELEIGAAELRGVASAGMACSARELGLSDDHSGLLELPADAPVGADLMDYLQLADHAIDLDLTPNRADCLGIRGLAQDVAAICAAAYTPLEIEAVLPVIDDRFEVVLEAPRDCPRYAGRVIRNIDPGAPTPLWMVEALRRCGVRSISATVDATNYVMLELGQPMHVFDLDTLEGRITVRRGRPGERLTLLDEKEVAVDEELLAICDESGPVAVAGIMGGLATGVTGKTTNVFLESAWFNPATISGRARALGLHTDASHRFERGVDPSAQAEAVERITALLLEITGGEPGPLVVAEEARHVPQPQAVSLRLSRLNRVLGSELRSAEVGRILASLGMRASEADGRWDVIAPPRRFDIAIEEDLIEEVARIHGYDALPATPPAGELRLRPISERRVGVVQAREALCAAGYQEVVNYSFVDRKLLAQLGMDHDVLPLANPISADMDVMRTALLPGLLQTLAQNLRRQQERLRLFETGRVFHQRDALQEIDRVAGVACGRAWPEQWGTGKRALDFYDLKGDVESLLDLRGLDAAPAGFEAADDVAWLHPGQAARVVIDGHPAGWVGAVHPGVLQALDIRAEVLAFELDFEVIAKREVPIAKEISRFPSVRRDLAFLLPDGVSYDQVRECATKSAGALLEKMIIFDVFSGQNVEKGYKSIAIGLIFQDVSCTLTDEVVDPLVARVIQEMEARLNAQHRG